MLNITDMPGNDSETMAIMDLFARLFSKAALIEKEPVDVGYGDLLHTSEIHLLDMAGRYPQENMSGIALRLGVTRGAVSQTVKKLEQKGYVQRLGEEGDNKNLTIRLTNRGARAFEWHLNYHANVNHIIAQEISRLDSHDRENIKNILMRLEQVFDGCAAARQKVSGQSRTDLLGGQPALK